MHFGDFAAAHEHLLKARAELPQRPGISQRRRTSPVTNRWLCSTKASSAALRGENHRPSYTSSA